MPAAPPPTPPAPQTPVHEIVSAADAVLDRVVLGNSVRAWIIAAAILLGLLVVVYLLRGILLSRLAKFAKKTKTQWDDVLLDILQKVRVWLIFPALLYFSVQSLALPDPLVKALKIVAIVGVAIQLILSSLRLVDAGLELLVKRSRGENGEQDVTVASSIGVLRFLALAVVAVVVVLLALDNLGVSITSMLTGLGVGGIAVALAVQNILGDVFGSLTILLDKPFVVGDFIIVGDKMGTVEHIGVKTTRVRALSGEQLVFGNADLLSSRIQNFKRMFERRVVFTIGVIYETSADHLRAIPGIIRDAVKGVEKTRLDRTNFKGFGAFSLDFETVYFVTNPDYNLYMNIQEAINLKLFEEFAARGISFAYPTSVSINRSEKEPPAGYHAITIGAAPPDKAPAAQSDGKPNH
ncbi:MAG TPA: mechanosensitive ion channel family protein [Phycisphaerales bacterium]|jgi:small-conductance mechanosensitive channel|nr:mechanosensitive ion channel family protein [Phycisphaerales bacterium]